ncbi:MAG: transposase [Bosea sp.]|nr:transposase [Bosea sp. (in: a-proteobacteria)]
MDVSDARRLKTLEDENARLKKLLAEQRLDNAILRDVAAKKVTPDAKRKAVAHACTVHAVSQRRACLALKIDRSTVRYTSTRPDDALLREAMKAAATERRRFGYRRIHIMLDRQGIVMNQKKLRRLYREEKLQVRRRGGRKRALGTRRPMLVPDRANARWSLDFLSDTISDGRRFRVLAVVATTRASAWRSSPTPRSRACAWLANWMASFACAAGRGRSCPTTAASSPRWRSCAGARRPGSRGITSPPASRRRMPSSRASTGASGTSASTTRCSRRSSRPAAPSPHGRRTTSSGCCRNSASRSRC